MAEPSDSRDPVDDHALIAAILAGETDRFRMLMERHQQAVFGYLYRLLLRDVELAQDLTQTVFLKAFRNLASVRGESGVLPWLLRIAHNEAANHLRRLKRHPEEGMEDEDWARIPEAGQVNPEEAAVQRQEAGQVNRALESLPPKMREALLLHYHEDRSYKEIAEILELSVGGVGALINRARNKLREMLEESPHEPDP